MSGAQRPKKLLKILELAADYLEQNGIENARLNAERLIAHSLNLDRVGVYLNYDRPLNEEELARFRGFLKRRAGKEPLQYILGETEFFSLPFKVTPSVLIPRPETETLVEKTIELCQQEGRFLQKIQILDIGTGSGCIAVSLAKNIADCQVLAIDLTDETLEIARENARLNEVLDRVRFQQLDFRKSEDRNRIKGPWHAIVSNPPYISGQDFEDLPEEIRDYEPEAALREGDAGLGFFDNIAQFARQSLHESGFACVEIGMGQGQAVERIFQKNEFEAISIFKDLAGLERIVLSEL